ncbi:MAG: 30S ribosomal protein S12 methylthiotransferase RimO [Desulfobacterales bacterium]|nr:30S ribosomal protein S12 methylthiotransferase RimO [Desulfobacterales bacterium]
MVSLGCARNLVDSEMMLSRLIQAGWQITQAPEEADTIVINTCSFIESAVNESIDTVIELARLKEAGVCRRLVVAGCLPERFREEIAGALPEVDLFLGTGAFEELVPALGNCLSQAKCILPDPNNSVLSGETLHRVRSHPHLAYLKIAEGCDRHCTYCIIPRLRGRQRCRQPEDILAEARALVASGVKELILISQDTTAYGKNLTPPTGLGHLLEHLHQGLRMGKAPCENGGVEDAPEKIWLRVLYGHPESLDDHTLRTIADHPDICSYFDLPVQHVSDKILQRMGRNYSGRDLVKLFDGIRTLMPDAALRTTVMVGFPGETTRDFRALLDFIRQVGFDHLGCFVYSDSQDLAAHRLSRHVPAGVAKARYDELMSVQAEISLAKNRRHIGQRYDVLVEKKIGKNHFSGRTRFQAPEVDGTTKIFSRHLETGRFARVTITGAGPYDLAAKPYQGKVDESFKPTPA